MHIKLYSKAWRLCSLLTLAVLLLSLLGVALVVSPATAQAAAASKTSLLKIQYKGETGFSAAKQAAVTNNVQAAAEDEDNLETRPGDEEEEDHDPKLAISGPTPPIQPPPAGTPLPNPSPLSVTTNNPGFKGFNGLSHLDQRNAGTGAYVNTQFSLEPPDQALCVSGSFVVDSVNTALAARKPDGTILSGPTAINQFFGLKPEVVRSTPPVFGDFTSDPKCYFDPDTQRWFLTVLQSDVDPATGAFTGPSHVLIAVSQTADPTGKWGLFSINTTNDGTNGTPKHPNCPCLGDQPLIGADANGFYVSTNEFPQFVNGFNGAQLYSISKKALVRAAKGDITLFPAVVLIDASQELVPFGGLSYSIQPATQPAKPVFGLENHGTEYFLSALEFLGSVDNRIAVWALTNTRSLDSSVPDLTLHLKVIRSENYGPPINVTQKDGPRPQGNALGLPPGTLSANDDRMNQVVFAQGVLWSGLNTGIQKPGEAARTGIAYFAVIPFFKHGDLDAFVAKQGYISVAGNSVLFPAIGVNFFGKGAATFTLAGPDFFPSAAYVPISLFNVGQVHVAGGGFAPEDGFTCYRGAFVCRWGDYSAAVAGPDGSIWLATESINNQPRTALANWNTFISNVKV
jgi:hypothetical protein